MATKRGKPGKQAYRGSERKAWPAWLWLILGAVLGVALSLGVLYGGKLPTLRNKNLPQPNPEAIAPRESEQPIADAVKTAPTPPKSNYDFYSVLPEKEVVIPDAELTAKAKAEQQKAQQQAQAAKAQAAASASPGGDVPVTPAATPAPGGRYMLQVAAVADPKAADELKAKLAMMGFSAKVYASNKDGKSINRVRLGPYATASETEAAKKALADNSINSVPVKEAN
jgi:cell division protein FtsN